MLFSRHIYWTILGHILFILATAGTGLWLIISQQGVVIGILLVICSLFQIGRLVNKLNSFNQKLRLFFDAIEDKDNMLYFPENNVSREQEMLNRSLNRINALLIRTQAEYSKQEHFYRSLLEEVPSGVLAWDSSGKIMMANSAALTLLGCQQLAQYDQLKPILQEKEKKERLSLSQNQMKLQNETITILSIKDISNELNDKESESWNKLSHVLTHEIMNTIAPIISLSQTLSAYPDNSEKTLRGLHIIQAQSERLLEFTESFRRLSYLPQPERKRFSLTALLQNLQELLSTDFQENQIHFTLTCQPEFIDMDGDENQLSQVLLNLLRNSIQALDGRTDGAIEIYAYRDEHISIDVTDNGPGIPDELQEKIFIPFFTTKSEGTGIGLSLCRQIIRNHNGHLSILESRPGKTIFHFEISLENKPFTAVEWLLSYKRILPDMHTKEQYWKYSLIVIILFMGVIIFRQITPFLGGLLGALTIYILVRGQMNHLVEKRKLKRSISALLITAETIFVFLIPLGLTVWMVANKLQDINLDPQTYIAPIQQVAEFIKEKTGYDVLGKDTLSFIMSILPRIGQIIMESISSLAINLFVMIFVLYFMLIGGKKMEAYVNDILPFNETNTQEVIHEINMIVRSNAIGIPLLAIIQGGVAMIGYLLFGAPNILMLGFLTCFATIIPMVGTALVWFPVAAYLAISGDWFNAIGLFGYGAIVVSQSDNLIRFILQKKMADTHPLITIFGVVIGLPIFGFMGVIFGPLLLSLFFLFVDMFKKEYLDLRNNLPSR